MELPLKKTAPQRITTAPPGRGWRARPEIAVNADYVRGLLEQSRLTERDEVLLQYLDELPVLSARQIKRLLWSDSGLSNMHRRLRALYDYHLLDRVRMLNKSEGVTYTLGKAGRLWLHGGETTLRGGAPPRVNVALLAHDLAVAEVILLLVEEVRRRDPSGQHVHLGFTGESRARLIHQDRVVIEPDGWLKVAVGEKYQLFFLELDTGSERAAAFQVKVQRYYQACHRPGLRDENNILPMVMVVPPTPERANMLAQTIAGVQPDRLAADLTWVISALSNLSKGFFGDQRWTVVRSGQIKSIRLGEL